MAATMSAESPVSKLDETKQKNDYVDFGGMRHLLRETINGYVFWCLFQALAPMIWFYPLNELEISGYEVYAALWFVQLITGIPGVLNLVQQQNVLGVLRALCVASLASYQASTTLSRLSILAVGNGIAMITLTATLWSPSKRIRSTTCWGLLLGYIAFVASRVWFVSFVPAWWSNQTNSVVIAVGAIAVIDQFISGFDGIQETEHSASEHKQPFSVPTGLGFGALMYLMNLAFGEVSLITRWTVRPYPNSGPSPYPWGAGTLLALCLGVYMSACRHMATSKVWWLIGTVSFFCLYHLPTWQGYGGGLVLAVYCMSIWPEMVDRATRCPPARTLFLAIFIFMFLNFFHVWTVAFNFVPLGEYTREHTDILILITMAAIFVGMFLGGTTDDEAHTSYVTLEKNKLPNTNFNTLLVLILCGGLLGFGARYNPTRYNHPEKTSPKRITTAIWTYHFGYDNAGWPSMERTAELLQNTGADVVTLLESDASKPFLGNNDLGMWLEEKLGFYVDFGPSTKDHTWGNLVLSKYPFVKSKHHLLPSPQGELAPAVTATVNVSGSLVDFVVTHMGNDRDTLDRKLQAQYLAKELKKSENPVVFMGYVTSKPKSREYKELIRMGNMKDIDATDRKRFCEYILYRGLKRLAYGRITHGGLSDTELQMAKFEIPEDSENYQDNLKVTFDTDQIDSDILLNPVFGKLFHNHGFFDTHRFHMSTPKYFLP